MSQPVIFHSFDPRDAAKDISLPAELPVLDQRERPLRDLRVSVTDRCNFRCRYCMPKERFAQDHVFLKHADILSFEEIERVARVFVGLGVKKIRLTGGEPLVRKHIENLIELLARLDIDIALTTNASLLAKKARVLRDAGLKRITVSLDAIDDATFRRMNDVDFPVAKVLEGIDSAAAAGFPTIKINAVVKRGLNEDAILPLARHFKGTGHILRFIEFMDVGSTNGWRMDDVITASEIIQTIGAEFPLEPVEPAYRGEVASRWRYKDGGGEIGVVASVTQPFCRDCTRMRLSATGELFNCLFAAQGFDLRALLRSESPVSDEELAKTVIALWRHRDSHYSEIRSNETANAAARKVEMSYIGG